MSHCLYRANVKDSERVCISQNADASDYLRQCVETVQEEPIVEIIISTKDTDLELNADYSLVIRR